MSLFFGTLGGGGGGGGRKDNQGSGAIFLV